MFLALRDLKYAKGRFFLMGLVVVLVAFLTTFLSGLASGLIKNNISGLMVLDATHLAFEYTDKPSYRNSMIERDMWEGWREVPGVLKAEPMGHAMFNARTIEEKTLDDVVLWGIEPGSFLEPAVLEGEQLGELDNGVIVSKLLVDRGVAIGDTIVLDRALTELKVIGTTEEHNIGHVPIIYTPIRLWQEAAYGPPGGPPPGEKLPDILYDFASIIALQIDADADPEVLTNADLDWGTQVLARDPEAYEASTGYKEEIQTVQLIQIFLILICGIVVSAFFTVWTIQRTKEIGLVKALGASNSYLLRDALGQVTLLLIIAVIVGTAAGYWLGLRFESSALSFQLEPVSVFITAVFIICAGLVGSALSVRLITQVDPIIALGRER
jgi:putative ABC transport system permease protein